MVPTFPFSVNLLTHSFQVWLRMSWKNEFLTWDPDDWGGVTETRANMDQVWTPDIFLQVAFIKHNYE